MFLNCAAGEDCWKSLGLQGDQTSQSLRKSTPNIHWKDWCWSWSSNTLATWCKEPTHWKRPWRRKDWGQEEKGVTETEVVGWYHWLNGMSLSKLRKIVKDRETWSAAIHGIAKSPAWLSDWRNMMFLLLCLIYCTQCIKFLFTYILVFQPNFYSHSMFFLLTQ